MRVEVVGQLVDRRKALGGDPGELTVTYDSGQNSTDNHAHIEGLGLGYVTSLPPSDHPELLAIDHDRFETVDADRYEGVTAHDTTVTALGVTRRAVITHSETFHHRAACLGSSLDFVDPGGKLALQACLDLCEACPVRAECYDLAVTEDHRHGVWGGTTERERQTTRAAA